MLVACTHRHTLRDLHNVEGHVEVTARNGHVYEATATQTVDGPRFAINDGLVLRAGDVTRVVHRNDVQGSLQGLALGALPGIAIGAIAGYSSGDDECGDSSGDCFLLMDAEDKALVGGSLLGLLAGTIGLIAGAVQGSQHIYEDEPSQVTVTPVGPSGSVAGVTVGF
ncbi:MAG TPA: hypothetical protein VK427_13740 [Kofleriaceae bacterium]|nr:hypothetical protein [Kofleriaceae bacterium]